MDGITVCTSILVSANGTAAFNNAGAQSYWVCDPTTFNSWVFAHQNVSSAALLGELNFEDPTLDVIDTFNQLMFRGTAMVTSGYAAWPDINRWLDPGVPVNQTVTAVQKKTQNVFHSELSWYTGAAVLQLMAVLLISPLFWGFWRLGCNVTMSPFSVALAFDSQILKDVNSAKGARGVVEELGDINLKFGVVGASVDGDVAPSSPTESEAISGRLGVAESQTVVQPIKGMRFRA